MARAPAPPATVHRRRPDGQHLVLFFPGGRKGSEKLYKDRYRLRRFGRGGFVEAAMRAGVLEGTIGGDKLTLRCLEYLEREGLTLDRGGAAGCDAAPGRRRTACH